MVLYVLGGFLMNVQEIWLKTIPILRQGLSDTSYQTWFSELSPIEINEGVFLLGSPSELSANMINTMYTEYIKKCVFSVCNKDYIIRVISLDIPESEKDYTISSVEILNNKSSKENRSLLLDPMLSFDHFVVGANNEFAHAASIAVAENPGQKYNPLLLYGGTGLGKTHLLQAIGNLIKNENPDTNIIYVTSEQFTNELIDAIHKRTNVAFREKYRNADVLLIDDIQFFASKERTQEEFFHTFNELKSRGKQIILTSDRPPREIYPLEARLQTRIEGGLMADIQPPDYETRLAILRKKMTLNEFQVELPFDVLNLIAQQVKTNIRELEGALKKIAAYHEISHKDINLEMAHTILRDYISALSNHQVDVDLIVYNVEQYFHLKNSEIKGSKRDRKIAYPRQIAMYICRELTNMSLPQIGNKFGGRDHSTVLHSVNKIKSEIETNLNTLNLINELISRIQS